MKSRRTRQFRDLFAALPTRVQQQAREAYKLFRDDPFIQVYTSRRSTRNRVGIGYRAVAVVDEDTAIWFWIGSHADYEIA